MARTGDTRSRSRGAKVRVKTARRRSASSARWLERQLNDPYVAEAKRLGYRSRAAFKLAELDDRFGFLKGAGRILDLGAAPGGWVQVARERAGPDARIVAVDLLSMEAVGGAEILELDFMADDAPERIREALGGPADVVLSDMAASTTGHKQTDHLRTMALLEAAYDFALEILAPGGAFVAKVLRGGTEAELLGAMKQHFESVRHVKPPASRKESTELYVVATGFRPDLSKN